MVLRKRNKLAAILGAGGLAAVIFFFRPRFIMRWVERNTSAEALFSIETQEKIIALTIDDGPHPEITPRILSILAAHEVKATFFLIGERVGEHEAVVRQIVAEGHEIGNHLMYDEPSIRLSAEEFERQLLTTDAILTPYAPVRWLRPGSGWYNKCMLALAKQHGYRSVIGSIYPYDAQISNVPFIVNYVVGNSFPGAIITLHDGTDERWHTITVLEQIIPKIKARGYRFVTLSVLAGE